jgi:hypothetical protein
MLKLGLENFSTYYDFLDIEKSEAEGCGLCAAIITEIPTTTLRSLKSGQYIRSLQVTLSGKRYEWGKSNTITLSISCGPFEKVQVEMYHNTGLSIFPLRNTFHANEIRTGSRSYVGADSIQN